ncbi:hypothetical protein SAMN05660462_01109 [Proteiniborus ethanoligenes]|uniref:UPF0182 protein SAMN05660462_01109 n=1 Tax=Proteiniborus ethanoligenes TaxID=415015 RepID=A0A1H3NFW2_9FIRM|nr:UPF0182 family protein [Proteiniborus ethanoligenes]SDY87812.1 hypothetical protein SAMN05660462_01109 [Proteiniborus ethanoligenes]
MKKGKRFGLGIAIFIIIVFISSFTEVVDFITDYQWFNELGYTKTFFTKLENQFLIGIPTFFAVFIIIMIYILSVKKNYYKLGNIIVDKKEEKKFNMFLSLISAAISIFMASVVSNRLWLEILQFKNATEFNVNDPIFNKEISFYVFKLPLLGEIISLLNLLLFMLIVITVVLYLVMLTVKRPATEESNVFEEQNFVNVKNLYKDITKRILNVALIQISVIGLIMFLLLGANYILKSYYLLYSPRGVVYGAGYTDIKITLWVYRIMAVLAVISAFGFIYGALKKRLKIALAGPILLIVVSLVGNLASIAIQKYIVEPDEISKEEQYLKYGIELTQKAYGIDNVEERIFPVSQNLTKEDILDNEETIKNIRINDYLPVNQVYNQLQGIRPYYRFTDVDIDRYYIEGKYTQVFLSARELDQERLSGQAQTWINKRLKYTHGYGVTASQVNETTPEGQPKLLIKNIPPVTETDLRIERPEIYFGEITNEYIIVNTDEKEFDYPMGDDNQETIYEGNAGIELKGLNKLLYAIKQSDFKLLISRNINSDSRIIMYRNINERVRKLAPFLHYDEDAYIVINQEDGKLYWILDAYSTTDRYPYSQPINDSGTNYVRNSVKVVIDAYNGDVKFYVVDENDPIVMTYGKIFKDLFTSIDKMPKGIKEHIRYSQDMFDIQAEIYRTYHIDNPRVLYNREDIWDIAKEKYMTEILEVESNYLMFKLPGEEKAEFLITVPYTPANRSNMISLLVGRNDGDNFGQLIIYKFPKSETIDGPMLIESRIDQDSEISPQLTLWSQKGSNVLRGNLLIIPIEDSLLYVEPVYLQADNENSLPEMKRVIVAYKNKIVMEETLDLALSKVFGQLTVEEDNKKPGAVVDIDIEDKDVEELVKRANELFINAKEASQNGDWAKYGEYIKQLEEVLVRLESVLVPEEVEEEQ